MALDTQPLFESAIPRDERLFGAQQKLSETMDALLTFDSHEKTESNIWITELRGALVDNIMLAVHEYATSKGVDSEDEQTRLDVARHFDAHLRRGHNPLHGLETVYEPSKNPPEEMFPISEAQSREFASFQELTMHYTVAAQVGYEELADL